MRINRQRAARELSPVFLTRRDVDCQFGRRSRASLLPEAAAPVQLRKGMGRAVLVERYDNTKDDLRQKLQKQSTCTHLV